MIVSARGGRWSELSRGGEESGVDPELGEAPGSGLVGHDGADETVVVARVAGVAPLEEERGQAAVVRVQVPGVADGRGRRGRRSCRRGQGDSGRGGGGWGPVEAGRAVPHSPGLASLSMLCLAGSGVGDALGGRLARERVVPPLHASGHVTIPVEHVFDILRPAGPGHRQGPAAPAAAKPASVTDSTKARVNVFPPWRCPSAMRLARAASSSLAVRSRVAATCSAAK